MLERSSRYFENFRRDSDPNKAALARMLVDGIEMWRRSYGDTINPQQEDLIRFEVSGLPSRIKINGLGRAEVLIGQEWIEKNLSILNNEERCHKQIVHKDHSGLLDSCDANEIQTLRKAVKLDQTSLGIYVGRSQAHISDIESGKTKVEWSVALGIVFLFGQDLSKIIKDTKEMTVIRERASSLGLKI